MELQHGTVIDGKYEILKQIGKGGMSVVYLAMDRRLNKQWAVKVIQKQGIGKNKEVIINSVPDDTELMKHLDHPAIPRIVDIIDRPEEPQIYIVMDYVEGDSLDKILKEHGAISQDLVIEWAKQICDTLGYLHSQNPPIIYRDMKPANVMLKPEGNIKLIDFGIAREYKEQNLADTTVYGTRGYASPELGSRQTDARSDIYSLGMTLHHLLTGKDPRKNEYAPIRQWNPELSGGLERIIDKCTQIDPANRYQNCNELMYDLEHYEEIDENYRQKQWKKVLMFILSGSFAVLFAILGFIGIYINNWAENKDYGNNIIFTSNSTFESVKNSVDAATKIDPARIDAYENLLDYIKDDININISDDQLFAHLFDDILSIEYANGKVDQEKFGKLVYEAGKAYFFYYNTENNSTLSERAGQAKKYFEYLYDAESGEMKLPVDNEEVVKAYYTICNFYKSDFENDVYSVDYKEQYADLFKSINELIIALDNFKGDAKKGDSKATDVYFVRSTMYKAVLDLVDTDIKKIANPNYGKMKKDTVDSLLNTILEKTQAIPESEKGRTESNRSYILNNIDKVKQNVDSYYKTIENNSNNANSIGN